MPTRPAMPTTVTSSPSPRPPFPWLADYRLAPVIVPPLWSFVFIVVVMLLIRSHRNKKGIAYSIVLLLFVSPYYMGSKHFTLFLYVVLVLLRILRLLMIPA